MPNLIRCFLLFMIAFSYPSTSFSSVDKVASKGIVALVSDRSSGSLVTAAHRYLDLHPAMDIQIRSVSQINLMSDTQLATLLKGADAVLMAAVFAEPVERLLNLNYPEQQTRIVINSDRRLLSLNSDPLNRYQSGLFTDLSNDQKKSLFQRLTNLEKGSYSEQLAEQQKQWPQFAYWLQAKAYWQNRNEENRLSLFDLLVIDSSVVDQTSARERWADLKTIETLRFYLNAKEKKDQTELINLLKA